MIVRKPGWGGVTRRRVVKSNMLDTIIDMTMVPMLLIVVFLVLLGVLGKLSVDHSSDLVSSSITPDKIEVPLLTDPEIPIRCGDWVLRCREILRDCHRGQYDQAFLLTMFIDEVKDLNDVCKGFTRKEALVYAARESYYGCRQGHYLGSASLLESYVKEDKIPYKKIAPGFDTKELESYLKKEDEEMNQALEQLSEDAHQPGPRMMPLLPEPDMIKKI